MNKLSVHVFCEPDNNSKTLHVIDPTDVTLEVHGTGVLVPFCEHVLERGEELRIKPSVKFHGTDGIYSEEWIDVRKSEDIPIIKGENVIGSTYVIQVEVNTDNFYSDEPQKDVPATPPESIRYIVKYLADLGCRIDLIFGGFGDSNEIECYNLAEFEKAWNLYPSGNWGW